MRKANIVRLAAAAAALFLSLPAEADGLIDNVAGVTLDDKGAVVRFTGIWITREGNIHALLHEKQRRP